MCATDVEALPSQTEAAVPSRRHPPAPDDVLTFTELDPLSVIDDDNAPDQPCELITFGDTREYCPACQTKHLKLVLRQRNVRLAHMFCPACERCFDAHYPNGKSALTI